MDPLPAPLVLLFAMAITLAVFVPLTGVLVRFRANYNPKGLQLDTEGGAAPYTGPIVNSYFGMMFRVYRLEVSTLPFSEKDLNGMHRQGVAGLYKGLSMSNLPPSIVIEPCL